MADKNAKIKISGAKHNFTGGVCAKKQVHVKGIVEIAATGAKKAKKVPRARSEVRPRGGQKTRKPKISGAKHNFTGRVSAKKQVHVKRIVEIAATGAKKAKKKCRVREARLGHVADKNAKTKDFGSET